MNGMMLGRFGASAHGKSGQQRCGCCEIGWPVGRRARKAFERREWRREVEREGADGDARRRPVS